MTARQATLLDPATTPAIEIPVAAVRRRVDLTGQKFHRLTVIGMVTVNGKGACECICDCGAKKTVDSYGLRSGQTKSCGCYNREIASIRHKTHGLRRAPEYAVWRAMLQRCEDKNQPFFFRYGGRGISVCERWHSFENFIADMGRRPSSMHTIERGRNDGNYEPSNCYWATRKEQARNRSSSRIVTIAGVSKTLAEWSEISGIRSVTIAWRLRHGYPESLLLSPAVKGANGRA